MLGKLGPHILQSTPQGIAWAKVAPVVKAVDNVDPLRLARPEAIKVFRVTARYESALSFEIAIRDRLAGYRDPNLYVEIDNERERDWSVGDTAMIVTWLHKAGIKVAIPSWSTGAYENVNWTGGRIRNWDGADAISLHCYWGNQKFTQWHATRFQQFWQRGDPPVIITECGRDAVEGGKGGWKADGISPEQYVAELSDYDLVLRRYYPYVLGATVFTSGPFAGSKWEAYETDSLPLDLTPAPINGGGTTMPTYQFAFADLARKLGAETVGEPLEQQGPQNYDGHGNVMLFTTKGIMYYNARVNMAHFLAGTFPKVQLPII